jgi:two-component system chemotaxis response regulator CheB
MAPIRVLVADDSITVRKHLVQALSTDRELEVIAEAADGSAVTELCRRLHPDVVTMDVMMPVMDGVTATEFIMAHCPTPILMVSAASNRGQMLPTFDALAAGAVDVLDKPSGGALDRAWESKLIAAVKMVSRIKAIKRSSINRRSRVVGASAKLLEGLVLPALEREEAVMVAIGASIGGPAAIVKILSQIPTGFPLPILLVIHVAPEFAPGLVQWIATGSKQRRVRVAVNGEPMPRPLSREILMPPPDRHLVVGEGRLWTTDSPQRHLCRPSIDELFESIARECSSQAIACLLTGMGKDGARGLLAVRQSGGQTIAQDEASSVVFGMPREAIALDAAQVVAPLEAVAKTLCLMAQQRRRDGEAICR